MYQVAKDTVLRELIEKAPGAGGVFRSEAMRCWGPNDKVGTYCGGCEMSEEKTIADFCKAHSADPDAFVVRVNAYLRSQNL